MRKTRKLHINKADNSKGTLTKGTVRVQFSKGFGNNIFQYCFGRLLAEHHGLKFSHPSIPHFGIRKKAHRFNKKFKIICPHVVKNNKKDILKLKRELDKCHIKYFGKKNNQINFDFTKHFFYFEDYTLYEPYLERIRSWFPSIKERNSKDLVLHLRLQNRIIQDTHYLDRVPLEAYTDIMRSKFEFDKLYIVSDCQEWRYVDKNDIKILHQKFKTTRYSFIPIDDSIKYMNSFIDAFSDFNPIFVHSKNFIDDFNFIRSFDQVLFKNSTFAWWAAVLGGSKKVGVYGPWKPNKGKRNKNLGRADFPGWFSWK